MRYSRFDVSRRQRLPRRDQRKAAPLTVCVAAICQGNIIVGASDRLLTTGDIQFAPPQTKIVRLTQSIAAMFAGDTALCHDLAMRVREDVLHDEQPGSLTVRECAERFRDHYQRMFLERASNHVLAPLGLDHESFLSRQRDLDPALVSQLTAELWRFEPTPEGVQAIFTGLDNSGAHLYMVNGSTVDLYDAVGFVAIGTGARHAQSQLMFVEHTSTVSFHRTLLQVYWAKKRAEVAPGVGDKTDMFVIGPELNSYLPMPENSLLRIAQVYETARKLERQAQEEAEATMLASVERVTSDHAENAPNAETGRRSGRRSKKKAVQQQSASTGEG